jgi:hypothetical protein
MLTLFGQGIAINTTGAAPDTSAILDIEDTDKGILIPRVNITDLSTTAPISLPANSLLVYNINGTTGTGFYYWNSSLGTWVKINDSASLIDKVDDLEDGKSDNDGSDDGSSIFIGLRAGMNDDGSDNRNASFGYASMISNLLGFNNAAMGYEALNTNSNGNNNVAIGYQASKEAVSADNNTAVGAQALYNNTEDNNTAIGYQTQYNGTIGDKNTSLGVQSLYTNSNGDENVAVGHQTLYSNTGSSNTAIGTEVLYNNTSGYRNTALGFQSLHGNIVSWENTAIGYRSLYTSGGVQNTAVGANALTNNTASENVAVGYNALSGNTSGSKNTVVGFNSGSTGAAEMNTSVGYQSGRGTGNFNTSMGYHALSLNQSGTSNTAFGWQALFSNTTGAANVALGSGSLQSSTLGHGNIAIGFNTGADVVNQDNLILIGNDVEPSLWWDNMLNIGNLIYGTNLGTGSTVSTGNVGIGIELPITTKLHVDGGITIGDHSGGTTEGAMKYVSADSDFYGYNGSNWVSLTGQNGWKLDGNTGTTSGTDFIGTADSVHLDFRTKNWLKLRLTVAGRIETHNFHEGVYIGDGAGYKTETSGFTGLTRSVFIGDSSGVEGSFGSVGIGYHALKNSVADFNTSIGFVSMENNVNGEYNTAIGTYSKVNNNGSENVVIGHDAESEGDGGVSIGVNSLSGDSSVVIGLHAGSDSPWSVNIGYNAGSGTGTNNNAIGYEALASNTSGYSNNAIGYQTLYKNTTGYRNIASGAQAGYYNTTGYSNISIGHQSSYRNTEGARNVSIGTHALYYSITNTDNVVIGYETFKNLSGTMGAIAEGNNNGNVGLGNEIAKNILAGSNNVSIGHRSLFSASVVQQNTSVGAASLYSTTFGDYNTALGYASLYSNTNGNYNTALGYSAYVFGTYDNSTALGYSASITASNQVRIGNASVTSIGGQVGWTTLSDGRFKEEVQDSVVGLDFIMKLRPVSYKLNLGALAEHLNTPDSLRIEDSEKEAGNVIHNGFIAQEVEKAAEETGFDFHGVDAPKNEDDYYGLRYSEFVPSLVKAVQEQQVIIDTQQALIQELETRLEALEK